MRSTASSRSPREAMHRARFLKLTSLGVAAGASLSLDVAATAARGLAQATSGQTVRVGWVKAFAWTAWAAAMPSVKGATVDLVPFGSSNEELVALASGSIDLAPIGYNNVASLLAAGAVPGKFVSGISANGSVFVARKGSGIRNWPDLRGKKVGSVRGSTQYVNLVTALAQHHLDITKDVEFVSIQSFNDLNLALQQGNVDAICTFPPLSEQAIQAGYGERVDPIQKTLYDGSFFVASGILASDRIIQSNPAAVQRIIDAFIAQANAYQANHAAWVQKFQSLASTSIQPALLTEAIDRHEVELYPELNERQIGLVAQTLYKLKVIPTDTSAQLVQRLDYTFLAKATGKTPKQLGKA